jgi:adenylate cyclase
MAANPKSLREQFDRDRGFFREIRDLANGSVKPGVTRGAVVESLNKSLAAARMAVAPGAVIPFGSLQARIRPAFDKGLPGAPRFGDHPEYKHLRGTSHTEHGAITTLFLDIANSTRLGLIYPLDLVYIIKNAVICAAIEIVNAFDGHVHRLMGDAVMAFFGSKHGTRENGAIDAINCAAMLRYYIDAIVVPFLEDVGADEGIGIRIGVDHGPSDKVLWSAYGYPGFEEVTATSFHVDVAAKLQHAAGKNQIMIGEQLRALLDLPAELLSTRTVTESGQAKLLPYVTPNYKLSSGPHNYRQWVLNWEQYLLATPVALADPGRFMKEATHPAAFMIDVTVHPQKGSSFQEAMYAGGTRMLRKERWLRLAIRKTDIYIKDAYVRVEVENHGAEAARDEGGKNGNHSDSSIVVTTQSPSAVHWERTLYRGLHYVTLTMYGTPARTGTPLFRQRIGVYIE